MRQLDISISLQENGTSGFILKDLTNVQDFGFANASNAINSEYLRVNDITIVDFVTYNRLSDPETVPFIYPVNSLAEYRRYALDYKAERDGWYTISHLIVPKLSWFIQINKAYVEDGTYYFYNQDNATFVRAIKSGEDIAYTSNIDPYLVYVAIDNPTTIGVEEDIFIIGRLEACFEEKIKAILYGKLYTRCQTPNDRDTIFRDRDMVWMTLELLKYLIRYCKYSEAQRILEMVDSCNGFCNNTKYRDGYKFNKGCNCG